MKIEILSRAAITELIGRGFPKKRAVISFFTPNMNGGGEGRRVDFRGCAERVFFVGIPDIDIEILSDFGYTLDSYFAEADSLAEFIYKAREDGLDIICQCDFGQSRSAAAAAAIMQHFFGCGIEIFADYRYYPNQLVYNKLFSALEKYKSGV